MKSTKKLATAALLALGLLALFAGPASAMKYSLNIAHPEGLSTGTMRVGGMATDSAGNLYMAQGVVVEKYTSAGKYLMKFSPNAGVVVKDVDVDSAGNVWAAAGGNLYKFNSTGTLLKTAANGENPANALTVDSAGNVYGLGPWLVFPFDSNGNMLPMGNWFSQSFGGHSIDLDYDSTGRIWSDMYSGNTIRRFDTSGNLLNQWAPATTPAGVAGDNAGNVWVAEPGGCRVRKYDATGKALETFGECGTGAGKFLNERMPHERPGIAWGPGGVVWVSNGIEAQKWIP
jgi:streptogramin lyase